MTETSKNYIYTSGYQLLLIALPLITVPYVTRVIGAEGLGIYAYTYSIIQFFILFIMLGVNNYGCRTIAKNRTEKHILTEKFWEIYKLQFLLGILMISLLFIYILFSTIEYKLVLILQILNLLAAIFDINWFFFGIEKFKLTVYRNAIIKIIALLCIFIFVKTNSDLWIYTVIISGSMLLSQLILFIFLFKHISYVNTSVKDIAKHIKPNLILFLPVIATSIYMIGSKIILADLTTMTQLGYYDNVEKLKNVSMGLISSLGIVMLPRISNMIENGEIEKIKQFNNISIKFVMFISFALAFGLAAISEELIPVFLGPEFKTCILLLKFLVVTIIIASWASVIRTQILIPYNNDKPYIISTFIGAFSNIISNFILIPIFQALGAVLSAIISEFVVAFYQSFYIKNHLIITNILKFIFIYLIAGIVMYIGVRLIAHYFIVNILYLILELICGGCIYLIVCCFLFFLFEKVKISTIINILRY